MLSFCLHRSLSDATNLHIVSRELLKAINSASLLTYGEYEERYPQGEKVWEELRTGNSGI
jgi:hypothetical protein